MTADRASLSGATQNTAAAPWPPPDTVRAIGEQAQKLSTFIRDTLPTTAGRRPFGAFFPPGPVMRELDRLTYLFYGRTLADFEDDRKESARLGWAISLAGWIVGTPGPNEHPDFEQHLTHGSIMMAHADYRGWQNPVPSHVGALCNAVTTLRVYFGQIVFARSHWIRAGEWLRQEIRSIFGLSPQARLGPWFEGDYCRMPSYLLRPPERYAAPAQLKGPLPVPDEIRRCGTFDSPKTDGIPIEWLDTIDHHAAKLLAALSTSPRRQPLPNQEQLVERRNLKPSQERAYSQYKAAIAREPSLAEGTDQQVYEYVGDNLLDEGERLPKPETWKKYVRAGRQANEERKNQPRIGRVGRSVIRADEI